MTETILYQITYSEETANHLSPGYLALDARINARHDWREYWPIRNFLLSATLDEDCYYGFFSPRFQEKTGLTAAQVRDFITAASPDTDVFTFSPQADMGAFFLNVFEQEELFQPGFMQASQDFFAAIGIAVNIPGLVMDSRQVVFSNYLVARPAFWRRWLAINEQLFAICEGTESALQQILTEETGYKGAVQRKVFLMERIASFLLTIEPHWKVKAFDTFVCAYSASRLGDFKLEAVISDALKIAMREQGFPEYIAAFAQIRDKLR